MLRPTERAVNMEVFFSLEIFGKSATIESNINEDKLVYLTNNKLIFNEFEDLDKRGGFI